MKDRRNTTSVGVFGQVIVKQSDEIEAYDSLPPEVRKAVREFPLAISALALKNAIAERPGVPTWQWVHYVNARARQFIDYSNTERGI